MRKIITDNLVYPHQALENKIEGTVKLKYDVDYKGNVRNVLVTEGIGHGCDEEAIRLITLFDFNVEKIRKKKVIFHKTIQIHFKLPVQKKIAKKQTSKTPNTSSYHYTITTSKKEPLKEQSTPSYTYTVQVQK